MNPRASLDPLFRLLVQTLSAQDAPRLHQPIILNQLMDELVPYRVARRELDVHTAEDYETLILRLCSGEGAYVEADPAAQEAMAAELRKPLPDLGLLRVWGDTAVQLRPDPLREVMKGNPEARYAPPTAKPAVTWKADPVVELRTPPAAETPAPEPPAAEEGRPTVRCPFCGGILPPRMAINFCPHCGMGQDAGTCRTCGADIDVGWRYCISCGEEVAGGGT